MTAEDECSTECLMKVSGVCKHFGFVQALKNVSFEVGQNEIVGLIGDNGAGKSTLIKTLTGVHRADSGELHWKGRKLTNYSVHDARDMGIVTVFQDRALSEQHLDLAERLHGEGAHGSGRGSCAIKKQKEETQKLMKEMMGFTSSFVTPDTPVGNMSGGERQGVAICRALYFEADLIILDEPTGGLSLSETRKVLKFVSSIKESGKSCIFISHNMFHVYPVADRIIILDRGEIVDTFVKGQISIEKLEATAPGDRGNERHRPQGAGRQQGRRTGVSSTADRTRASGGCRHDASREDPDGAESSGAGSLPGLRQLHPRVRGAAEGGPGHTASAPTTTRTEEGNTYQLERALDLDMLLTSVGWANGYYANETYNPGQGGYTDEWGITWKNTPYSTRFGDGFYTEMVGCPLADDARDRGLPRPRSDRPELYAEVRSG